MPRLDDGCLDLDLDRPDRGDDFEEVHAGLNDRIRILASSADSRAAIAMRVCVLRRFKSASATESAQIVR
jgi:hypothetical protein